MELIIGIVVGITDGLRYAPDSLCKAVGGAAFMSDLSTVSSAST